MLRKPRVPAFDEPTGNLFPKIAMQALSKILEVRDKLDITTIPVEQSARRAVEVRQNAYLLISGRPVFEGEPRELLSHPELTKPNLGIKVDSSSPTGPNLSK